MKQDGIIAQSLSGRGAFALLPYLCLTAGRVGVKTLKCREDRNYSTPSATLEPEGHKNGTEDLASALYIRTSFPSLALKGWRQEVRVETRLFPSR